MKSIILLPCPVLLILLQACSDSKQQLLMPEIADCDSAAVLFYHEPGKPRYFDMAKVYDKNILPVFSADVNGRLLTGKDSCTTEGKIYFYGKGDAVYVVYFSRLPACMTLSFIKTGVKYYAEMGKEVNELLDNLRKEAIEPTTNDQD
jgi:hypothetical protein